MCASDFLCGVSGGPYLFLDTEHVTPSRFDTNVNELDYSVISDLKDTSVSHSSNNELNSVHVTTKHCDINVIVNGLWQF